MARRVSEYLVVMLIGPAIAVFAMVLLARVEASDVLARLSGLATGDAGALGSAHLTPYVMVVALFAFVYVYMPNTRVRFGPALVGALFGGRALGRASARCSPASSCTRRKTAAIYAGFAVVLLFLVWVYLSWLILLLGAQLSFYVQHPEHLRSGHAEVPLTGALRERRGAGGDVPRRRAIRRRRRRAGRSTASPSASTCRAPVLDQIVSPLQAARPGARRARTTPWRRRATSAPSRSTRSSTPSGTRRRTRAARRRAPCPMPTQAARIADEALRSSLRDRTLRDLGHPPRLRSLRASGAGDRHLLDEDRARCGCRRARRCRHPTSTMLRYMSRRLPAIVTSCTG
ncbi:MAG: YihY/virulence factor BrkB family protein [Chromatiales bacterium]|nr:YihY/virulence factor BrkB family protein [Chromatiales bacterium]